MTDPQEYEMELLLLDWEDGSIDEAGIARVRTILREDAGARKRFVQWQRLNATLHLESVAPVPPDFDRLYAASQAETVDLPDMVCDVAVQPAAKNASRALPISNWLLLAASILFAIVSFRWMQPEVANQSLVTKGPYQSETIGRGKEPTAEGLAVITKLVDVSGNENFVIGDSLTTGSFAISSGFAQIEFFCGATVVLEGPAQLDIHSAMSATCSQGRLRAQVPPAARGFEINAADMKIVDIGTEFGLSVDSGKVNVQVFDGEIELYEEGAEMLPVKAGQAFGKTVGDRLVPSRLTPESFIDVAALDSEASDDAAQRFSNWKRYSNQLRKDTRLIAYYGFDVNDTWNRKLRSDNVPRQADLDGAIVGAKFVAGRWPEKRALQFRHPADRVRIEIPGEFSSLTFACWVRIDSLDRWYNSLFLTDNYQQGEPHWQILDSGQLFFSVRVGRNGDKSEVEHREVLSPKFWKPSMSGQWLHLATVYDAEEATTTHYLNGEQISKESIPDEQLVTETRIGRASIGNWSIPTRPEDARFAIRNLNGCLDEFAIFSGALQAEEIAQMYQVGKQ